MPKIVRQIEISREFSRSWSCTCRAVHYPFAFYTPLRCSPHATKQYSSVFSHLYRSAGDTDCPRRSAHRSTASAFACAWYAPLAGPPAPHSTFATQLKNYITTSRLQRWRSARHTPTHAHTTHTRVCCVSTVTCAHVTVSHGSRSAFTTEST